MVSCYGNCSSTIKVVVVVLFQESVEVFVVVGDAGMPLGGGPWIGQSVRGKANRRLMKIEGGIL